MNLKMARALIVDAAVKAKGSGLITTSPKSQKGTRTIALDKAVVRVLKDHKASLTAAGTKSDLVFPGWDGTLFKPTTLDRKV